MPHILQGFERRAGNPIGGSIKAKALKKNSE
jgi:hypothetical protein